MALRAWLSRASMRLSARLLKYSPSTGPTCDGDLKSASPLLAWRLITYASTRGCATIQEAATSKESSTLFPPRSLLSQTPVPDADLPHDRPPPSKGGPASISHPAA